MPDTRHQERRRGRRIRVSQPFRISSSDPHDPPFTETGTTKNVSRAGIYFISQTASLREGMRLHVAVPFHSPAEPQDREYVGQVVRVDVLPDGQWGVAVQLLSDRTER